MAFERPIEADRVEDLGLFSSFIRAPVVGTILWLLGGEDAKKAEEEERRRQDGTDAANNDGDERDCDAEIEPWPQISAGVDDDSDDHNFPSYEKFVTSDISTPKPSKHSLDSGPASRVVDELVAVMDATSLDGGSMKRSPRRSSSRCDLAHLDSETGDVDKPSLSKPNLSSTSSSKKKMSWSDQAGQQPLVEYFDDRKHSSRYRRNSWKPSRSCSFDSQDTSSRNSLRGRSQVRVIKSALKRSGSYSPTMQMYAAPSESMSTSSQHSSTSGMKSFRSLSVVGSTDSDSVGCESPNESRHVPPSLQMGRGRASGGLIFPIGGPSFPGYHVTLGSAVPPKADVVVDKEESKTGHQQQGGHTPPLNKFPSMSHPHNSRSSKPHHFLPHHSNGYISPQYGFYVNITPPTPEMFYPRPPPGTFSDKSKSSQQQQPSHQQFAKQQKPFRPSPIPEVSTVVPPKENKKPPLQPMFQESPHSTHSGEKSLKPTFMKKNRMGMFLSDNPHQVFPTVPFG